MSRITYHPMPGRDLVYFAFLWGLICFLVGFAVGRLTT